MDPLSIGFSGTAAGLIIALAYGGKQVADSYRARRNANAATSSSAVNDAATANAALVETVDTLTKENKRLQERVQHLESVDVEKTRSINNLQAEVSRITAELDRLKKM